MQASLSVRRRFTHMDTNQDGLVSVDELVVALRKSHIPTSRATVEQMFDDMDLDQSGAISLDEFAKFCAKREKVLKAAFREIVRRGGGCSTCPITAGVWREAARKSGVNLSDDDLHVVMARLDLNGDKEVDFEEFLECLLLAPDVNPSAFFDSWFVDCFVDDAQSDFTTAREVRPTERTESFRMMVVKKLVCGGFAGFLSRTLTAPIDRIRILMMTSPTSISIETALGRAMIGGWQNLWIGNGINCMKITPEMAIKLLAFDVLKNSIAEDSTNITISERFVAGGIAGALAQVTVYPMEVVRTRLSVAKPGEYRSIAHCAQATLANGGFKAFYAGLGPSVFGIVPYAAIDLSLNSYLKDVAGEHLRKEQAEISVPLLLGCGMVSSAAATVATYPLYVIRTNAQATAEPVAQVVKRIYASGGLSAFYRGVVPCMAKVMPATSISYASFEFFSDQWKRTLL